MAKPLIEIKDLRKVYKIGDQRVVALNKIDLTMYEGEICCLLGTSGSGKSTLLNMMAGLEKPSKGSIVINGTNIEKLSEKQLAIFRQANIGFVFQSYNLLPSMTALENVAMPLLFDGVNKKTRVKAAKEMLASVGLGKHVNHRPTQMSGGQQQRVGIARAFVALPKIVFADEPTGNLDSKTTLEVMSIIINLSKVHNQTLVIVTHDPSIALYANKIVHILDGDIEYVEDNENPIDPDAAMQHEPDMAMPHEEAEQSKKEALQDETVPQKEIDEAKTKEIIE